jgi:hypothetical protein
MPNPTILLRRSQWINRHQTLDYAACTFSNLFIGIILARGWTISGALSTFPGEQTNQQNACFHHTGSWD